MRHQCSSSNCPSLTTGYSQYCNSHRLATKRHGHPNQRPVSIYALRPYLRQVVERRKANPTSPAWAILEQRWKAVVSWANQVIEVFETGQPACMPEVRAARQLNLIEGIVGVPSIIDTVLAMYLMQDWQPQSFRSDTAFEYQLVRRVRGLSPLGIGTYWDHNAGKTKRTYRDLPPRTVAVLAGKLIEAFGAAGVQFAGLERKRIDGPAIERRQLSDAIAALR